jgi:hypothetical protein
MSINKITEKVSSKKKKARTFVRDQDLFGHPITLNFDQDGPEHKTIIGGVFSIILKLMMFFYVLRLLLQLVTLGNPDIIRYTTFTDYEQDTEATEYKNLEAQIFFVFEKQMGGSLDDLLRYVDVSYSQFEVDNLSNPGKRILNETK